jgi:hypothetical protein
MSLRTVCATLLAGAGLAVCIDAAQARQEPARASVLLASARQALGGEARLSAIRSFRLSGSIERGVRSRSDYGSFDVACELPDRFVSSESLTRLSTYAAGRPDEERVASRLGFNGGLVIYHPAGRRGHPRNTPPHFGQAVVGHLLPQAQLDFVRMTIAMFAGSFAGAPVIFSDSTRPHTVIATVNNRRFELEFDPVTHLPARFGSLEYGDYRVVDGMRIPFAMALGTQSESVDTWRIDSVRFNVDIPDKAFKVN